MPSSEPFTQSEHDRAVEVGGMWLLAVALIAAAIIVGGMLT